MKVLSWNVQGAFPPQGSPDRIAEQVKYLHENAATPDILMLNEVSTNRRELWHSKLKEIGYNEIEDTLDIALEISKSNIPPYHDRGGSNGNLTAVHEDSPLRRLNRHLPSLSDDSVENSDLTHWSTNFPEKVLNTTVELPSAESDIDLWNVRTVPGSMYGEEKIKILENVYYRVMSKSSAYKCILAGDFNSPKDETDGGEVVPFGENKGGEIGERWREAERNIFVGLEEKEMIDVFRSIHGYGEVNALDVSHPTSGGDPTNGKRFDHIIASESLNPQDCRYDKDGLKCSDHAPITAEFELGNL